MIDWSSVSHRGVGPVPTSSQEPPFAYQWPQQSAPIRCPGSSLHGIATPGPVFAVRLTKRRTAAEAVARVQRTLEAPPIVVAPEKLLEAERDSV